MNVHHLELFFYVAKHEGITQAVRKMPYGIQQPAVSGQILQLEKELGLKLFNRRPFALTPAGEELYDFIYPFFSQLPTIGTRLRGEESQHLRLAASAAVLTNHLPDVLEKLRANHPDLRLTLKEINPSDVDDILATQEIDIAISLLHGKPGPGVHTRELMRLSLVLLAPKDSKIKRFRDLFKGRDVIDEPLITLPQNEIVNLIFQNELDKFGVQWTPRVEVNSLELIQNYVRLGYGYGLYLDIPSLKLPDNVIKIPLPKFPPLVIGLLFLGKLKPIAVEFANEALLAAKALTKTKNK